MAQEGEELPERMDPERARMAVARNEVTVIDVRSAEEYAEERIFGSAHADPGEVEAELPADGEAVLIVCSDGEQSAEIAERLRGDGRSAASIDGGFDAWTGDGLPTAPGRDEEYEGPEVKIPGAVASESGPDEDEDEEDSPGDESA